MPISVAASPWANETERTAHNEEVEMVAASQKMRRAAIPLWAWISGCVATAAIVATLVVVSN